MSTTAENTGTGLEILTPYQATKADLQEFIFGYSNLIVTPETLDGAKSVRQKIRERRYAIQKIEEERNDQLNLLKKNNKSNAAELIAILSKVEDRIDGEIKSIETEKEKIKEDKRIAIERRTQIRVAALLKVEAVFNGIAYTLGAETVSLKEITTLDDEKYNPILEKFYTEHDNANHALAKLTARIENLTSTGAVMQDGRYILLDSLVTAIDLERFSDENYEATLRAFEKTADEIQKQKKIKDLRFEERVKEITEMGLTRTSSGYSMPGVVYLNDEQDIYTLSAEEWQEKINEVIILISNKAEQELLAEQLIKLKAGIFKMRTQSLSALGMALTHNKYSFHGIEISIKDIEEMEDTEWADKHLVLENKINDKKVLLDREAATSLVRKQALIPDKEKLSEFVLSLMQITGPEIVDIAALNILTAALSGIKSIAQNVTAEIESL